MLFAKNFEAPQCLRGDLAFTQGYSPPLAEYLTLQYRHSQLHQQSQPDQLFKNSFVKRYEKKMALPQSESKPPAETTTIPANEDEEYDSEEDSDFDVDAAPAEGVAEEDSSDSEPDVDTGKGGKDVDGESTKRAKKRRRISAEDAADKGGGEEVIGELDSGDEATIRRGKARKKGKDKKGKGKKSKKGSGSRGGGAGDDDDGEDDDFDDEDGDGGEGGFVRTRGMRMKM